MDGLRKHVEFVPAACTVSCQVGAQSVDLAHMGWCSATVPLVQVALMGCSGETAKYALAVPMAPQLQVAESAEVASMGDLGMLAPSVMPAHMEVSLATANIALGAYMAANRHGAQSVVRASMANQDLHVASAVGVLMGSCSVSVLNVPLVPTGDGRHIARFVLDASMGK